MGKADSSYRRLFSHPELLRDLLACVMEAEDLNALDWSGLQVLETQYVGDALQQRAGDGAWRIPYRSGAGQDLYIVLVLEHQSGPDATMALRVATYAGLLYQSLLRQKLITLPLPPILPVVLYSGRRRWRAVTDVRDLVGSTPADLSGYQLRMRHLLIDEGALLRTGHLPDRNLAALLFRLQHSSSIEQIPELTDTLIQVLRGPQFEELNRSFTAYIQHIVLSRAQPIGPVPTVHTLQELSMLITEKPGLWARQWKREGLEIGRQEGQASLLERQLTRKFGELPEAVTARIREGSSAQLEAWSLNILEAGTLDEVFED